MNAALCQCTRCFSYLVDNRDPHGDLHDNTCSECHRWGIPRADIRGTLTTPLDLEILALLSEESSEVIQRIGKIQRWGWAASFAGSTQLDKLETELGDVLAAMLIAAHNGFLNESRVWNRAMDKLDKFREDAAGPKQRLLHAVVPPPFEPEKRKRKRKKKVVKSKKRGVR